MDTDETVTITRASLEALIRHLWPAAECPPDIECQQGVLDASEADCRACWLRWLDVTGNAGKRGEG